MPILTRGDGAHFAVYTYREILSAKSLSVLRREALVISRENGHFARFFPIGNAEVEAVFSPDQAYLLGELIWHHFGRPLDLIYCEALEDGENALLIVVRGGNVYLDAELPLVNLTDEFTSLISADNRYQIYTYGDVPLAEFATDEKFAFDAGLVDSFIELDTPVFPTLELDDAFKLLPLDDALEGFKPTTSPAVKAVIVVVVIAIVGYIAWKILSPKPAPTTQATRGSTIRATLSPKAASKSYASYQLMLETPSPSNILLRVVQDVELLLTIPGWSPAQMVYQDKALNFNIKPTGGDLSILLAWVRDNQIDLQADTGKAVLVFPLNTVPNRPKPEIIYNIRDTVASLYDILKRVMPDAGPKLGATTQQGSFKITQLTVTFSNLAPSMLVLLAREMEPYPIVLQTFVVNINSGLLSGTIQLQILGV